MFFSKDSDVTIVITSCGRFDLLRRTLLSLDRYNTYPIKEVIITEDSGLEEVRKTLPDKWNLYTKFIINRPKLGQLKSIDAAYSQVTTPWIFHCEDDWAFYRPYFIEESMKLLQMDTQALQVWLRSLSQDLAIHSPYIYVKERIVVDHIPFYHLCSKKGDWQGFSFNPGLRRLSDYKAYAPYSQYDGEKNLSRLYAFSNRYALILENDAVLHTGFGEHVTLPNEKVQKKKRKRREKIKNAMFLVLGAILTMLVINIL